jgi:hypothetical protein
VPLELVNLDDRSYTEILQELQDRIPRFAPEWTNRNDSDPGMTLLQLFAWLAESLQHRLNQVPDRTWSALLKLLGMELQPPRPALAHVSFTARSGFTGDITVPRGTQLLADRPQGGPPIVFETEDEVAVVRATLSDLWRVAVGANPTRITDNEPGTAFAPLGLQPGFGTALYLGWTPFEPAPVDAFPDVLRLYVATPTGRANPVQLTPSAIPVDPGVRLRWERLVEKGANGPYEERWQPVAVERDDTNALTRTGSIRLLGLAGLQPFKGVAGTSPDDERYWIRGRLDSGQYPAGQEPQLEVIRADTVDAFSLTTVRDELVGISDGSRDQTLTLANTPVEQKSIQISVLARPLDPTTTPTPEELDANRWLPVDRLVRPDNQLSVAFNPNSGQLTFGDGRGNGEIPPAGSEIWATYRAGGGSAANVAAGAINALATLVPGVDSVTNTYPASGGAAEKSIEELKRDAPQLLRARDRAVTADDFTQFAVQLEGVGRVDTVPLAHPDYPDIEVPGTISVLVCGDSGMPPQPTPQLLEGVARQLESHRLVTTELFVRAPEFRSVHVSAVLRVRRGGDLNGAREMAVGELDRLLRPLPDGNERWPLGAELHESAVIGALHRAPDVVGVEGLLIEVDGRPVSPGGVARFGPLELPYPAVPHDVRSEPEQDL